ncbi:hypothetical protein Q3G72_016690 [Acer saccharum]|nr:hypothetical protein Q3G72_016690 [Acer saccharum]
MDISISFLFLLLLQTPISSSKTFDNNILRQGSSLSVEKSSDQLISPNGVYSAGFFSVGDNAFSFAVWFTKSSPPTAAWMANRDMPVNGKGSKLSLLKNGDLSLTDATGIHIWNSKTFSGNSQTVQLVLADTGNLVLFTLENVPRLLWQSFDSPRILFYQINHLPTAPHNLSHQDAKVIALQVFINFTLTTTMFCGFFTLVL